MKGYFQKAVEVSDNENYCWTQDNHDGTFDFFITGMSSLMDRIKVEIDTDHLLIHEVIDDPDDKKKGLFIIIGHENYYQFVY